MTRKITKIRHYPETSYRKPIDIKKEIKAFYKITRQNYNSYSRCKLGKRCIKKTKKNTTFIKYTLVCAINTKEIVGYELYEKRGMNADRMVKNIDKFIKAKYVNNLIIMDNGGSHKNSKIKTSIEETK